MFISLSPDWNWPNFDVLILLFGFEPRKCTCSCTTFSQRMYLYTCRGRNPYNERKNSIRNILLEASSQLIGCCLCSKLNSLAVVCPCIGDSVFMCLHYLVYFHACYFTHNNNAKHKNQKAVAKASLVHNNNNNNYFLFAFSGSFFPIQISSNRLWIMLIVKVARNNMNSMNI